MKESLSSDECRTKSLEVSFLLASFKLYTTNHLFRKKSVKSVRKVRKKQRMIFKHWYLVSWPSGWESRNCDKHSLGLKPTHAILLFPGEKYFATFSPAWRSWKAVLNFSYISKKLKKTNKKFLPDSNSFWHLWKQIGVIA